MATVTYRSPPLCSICAATSAEIISGVGLIRSEEENGVEHPFLVILTFLFIPHYSKTSVKDKRRRKVNKCITIQTSTESSSLESVSVSAAHVKPMREDMDDPGGGGGGNTADRADRPTEHEILRYGGGGARACRPDRGGGGSNRGSRWSHDWSGHRFCRWKIFQQHSAVWWRSNNLTPPPPTHTHFITQHKGLARRSVPGPGAAAGSASV